MMALFAWLMLFHVTTVQAVLFSNAMTVSIARGPPVDYTDNISGSSEPGSQLNVSDSHDVGCLIDTFEAPHYSYACVPLSDHFTAHKPPPFECEFAALRTVGVIGEKVGKTKVVDRTGEESSTINPTSYSIGFSTPPPCPMVRVRTTPTIYCTI